METIAHCIFRSYALLITASMAQCIAVLSHANALDQYVSKVIEKNYTDTHPLVESGEFKHRYLHTNIESAMDNPDFNGVSIKLWLPAGYKSNESYPLLLYLKWPDVPEDIHKIFDRYGVVFASVLNTNTQVGSQKWVQQNAQLALNAVHNISTEFSIDTQRVYVGGVSGGAASAIHLAPIFPDVFRGGLFFASGGGLDFRTVKTAYLDMAKTQARYFFATGDKDRSQQELLKQYRDFESAGFENMLLVNEIEIGHDTPPARFFEKGWQFLEGDAQGSLPGAADVSLLQQLLYSLDVFGKKKAALILTLFLFGVGALFFCLRRYS